MTWVEKHHPSMAPWQVSITALTGRRRRVKAKALAQRRAERLRRQLIPLNPAGGNRAALSGDCRSA